ncbi:MAG: AmmeMemoRadiSam system protein B [Thermoplasmata archaeon]|nr:AmmeMemoRadiSam system protein B [Thermoplasmata archaeon]
MPDAPRHPAVAGQFYPSDGAALTQVIEQTFLDRRGPGHLPVRHRSVDRRIRAAVVPHAGYVYSGAIAAHAFAAIAAERAPSTVLLLGVNHAARGAPAALSGRDWLTPLGRVPVDRDLVRALDHRPIEVDETAHAREHSIEVELPYLQYVVPFPRFAALTISMGPVGFLADVAAVVRQATLGRDVLLIASTDFSHYISAAEAQRKDRLALEPLLKRDPHGLYSTVVEQEISMCGIAPTTVLLFATQDEPLDARLLRWGHSGEAESMNEVVGYASALLESRVPLPPPAPGAS